MRKKISDYQNVYLDDRECFGKFDPDQINIDTELLPYEFQMSINMHGDLDNAAISGAQIAYLYNLGIDPSDPICAKLINSMMSPQDFENQLDYLESLSDFEKNIIELYTYIGDRALHSYIRSGLSLTAENEAFMQENANYFNFKWPNIPKTLRGKALKLKRLEIMSRTLNQIILNAPPIMKSFDVYRGLKTIQHLQQETISSQFLVNKSILSTSLSINTALSFSSAENGGITKILIPEGSRCLLNSNKMDEFEIILNAGCNFQIIQDFSAKEYILTNQDEPFDTEPTVIMTNVLKLISNEPN